MISKFKALLLIALLQQVAALHPLLPPENAPFGHNLLPYFMFESGLKNFNHGSLGATPRLVMQAQRNFSAQVESNPDMWLVEGYFTCAAETREMLAKYIGANVDDVVLVPCASEAVNAVVKALDFQSGDKLLYTSIAYPMVPYTVQYVADRQNLETVIMNVTFPTNDDAILAVAEETLVNNLALCHRYNVLVLIDGAHSLGQIPLQVTDIGADYYVATAYKWFYGPKGTAMMWVAPNRQDHIVPTVISATGMLDYQGSFLYTGSIDYTPYCALQASYTFRQQLGDDRIMKHMHNLALWAGGALSSLWNTEVLGVPESNVAAMINVRLPTTDPNVVKAIGHQLLFNYKTTTRIFDVQGAPYMRVGGQIYLEKSDFIWLGNCVLSIINNSTCSSN